MEPPAYQAMDRRRGAGGAGAELPAARAGRAARVTAARASRLLARGRDRRPIGEGAWTAVRARPDTRPAKAPDSRRAAARRRSGARFFLGHRRADRDAL